MCRPDVTLRPAWRPWAACLTVFCAAAGCGPLVDPSPYDALAIYGTIRAMLPWEAWAGLWLAAAALVGYATLSLSARAWTFGTLIATATGMAWLGAILWEHYADGAPISPTGMGLWSWFVTSNLIAVTSRGQFEGRGGGG